MTSSKRDPATLRRAFRLRPGQPSSGGVKRFLYSVRHRFWIQPKSRSPEPVLARPVRLWRISATVRGESHPRANTVLYIVFYPCLSILSQCSRTCDQDRLWPVCITAGETGVTLQGWGYLKFATSAPEGP